MTVKTAPLTLEDVRDDEAGQSFPHSVLRGHKTALVLFAAGFLGKQDAYWVAKAGLTATCVDNDQNLLCQMADLYPPDWCFLSDDAFEYVMETRRRWDVVTVDCPSGAFARCASLVGMWCSRARVAVVLGTGINTTVEPPDGWCVTERLHRSNYDGGVFWTVLERACFGGGISDE